MKKRTILSVMLIVAMWGSIFAQGSGTCTHFDGTNDYVNCSTGSQITGNYARTIEAWAYTESFNNGGIFQAGLTGSNLEDFSFRTLAIDDNWRVQLWGTDFDVILENSNNSWHHYCLTYDGTIIKLFFDGNLKVSENIALNTGSHDVYFGRWKDDYFNGKIDEMRIWDIARDSVQIRENMYLQLEGNETGLVSYWQFNDGSGTTLSDMVSGNNGTLINMTDDDWVDSTIPFGPGYSDSQTEANGTVDFTDTGLSMYFNSQNAAEITVTRIDTTANKNPYVTDEVFDNQYWVVNRYGNGGFDVNLTFTLSEDLTTADEADPSQIVLFSRSSTSDTNWVCQKTATSVSAINNEVTFSGINHFSQFIIGRTNGAYISTDEDVFSITAPVNEIVSDTLTIYNIGNDTLSVTNISNNSSLFTSNISACTILPSDSCKLTISFSPISKGTFTDTLKISSNDPDEAEKRVVLYGKALRANIIFLQSPDSLQYITSNLDSIDVGSYATPTFTDLDGDGLLDMLIGGYSGNIIHYEQDSINSQSFTLITEYFNSINVGNFSKPTFTDLDGDGLLDMLIGADYHIAHFEQDSVNSTSFTMVTNNFNNINFAYPAPIFTDLDGDGLLDMLIGQDEFGADPIHHYEQNSINSTSFTLVSDNIIPSYLFNFSSPSITDLDGDGLLDMLVGVSSGNIIQFEQDSINSISFSLITENFNSIDVGSKATPTFTDFNGDGAMDMIIGESYGSISHYEQFGVNSFYFGKLLPGNSTIKSYYLKASDLLADLDINCTDAAFSVSLSKNSGYSQSLSITPVNGLVFDSIFVKFSPTQEMDNNSNIEHTCYDAQRNIALTGSCGGIDNFPGTALDFDGIDDYVNIPHSAIGNPAGDFTIEAWVKLHDIPPDSADIISKRKNEGGSSRSGYAFAYDSTGIKAFLGTTNGWKSVQGNVWTTDEWHHISMIYNASTHILKLLDDGILQDTITVNNPSFNTTDLRFGSSEYYSDNLFSGEIEEVRIWDVARTEEQIRENIYLPLTESEAGLVNYWQFNKGSGVMADDIISKNHGTLTNMTNNNWKNSYIPFGSGYSNTQIVNNTGTYNFIDANLSMNITSYDTTATIVSTIIDTVPNLNPTIVDEVFDNQYWVVNTLEGDSITTDITFTITENLTTEDESYPTIIKLYRRPSNYYASWVYLADANSVNATNHTVTFTDITSFGQYIIVRWHKNPQITTLKPDIFNLVTNNFNSINVGDNSAPTFTDLDGDGLLDLFIGNGHGEIIRYEQNSINSTSFTLLTECFDSIDVGWVSKPTFIDLDSDGLLDLLIGESDGNVYHYEQNSGDPESFTLISEHFVSLIADWPVPTFTDLDGDGLLDMLVGSYFLIDHYEQDSKNSNSFTYVSKIIDNFEAGSNLAPAIVDLDGGGVLDLIFGEGFGETYINHYKQDSINSISFNLITKHFSSVDVSSCPTPTFTDLDGDGLLDMLLGEFEGNINHYEQQGVDSLYFGKLSVGNSLIKNYCIKANNLFEDLNINCTGTAFSISFSENSGYTQSLSMVPVNGVVSDTIFVKFSPTQEIDYSGNIEHNSYEAQTQSIVLSGSGIRIDNFPGTALDFDGIDDYVSLGNSSNLKPTDSLSIESWVYYDDWSSLGQDRIISNTQGGGYNMGTNSSGNIIATVMLNGSYVSLSTPTGGMSSGWHHIAMTCDGQYTKLYIDGEIKAENDAGDDFPIEYHSTNHTLLGAEAGGGSSPDAGYYLNGKIDEVRIWNIALDSIQIREEMHLSLTGAETGLVSYWQFNEGSGTSLGDVFTDYQGTLDNMDDTDWVSSSIPFGDGFASSQTESSGTVAFTNTGLTMDFAAQSGAEITATRIDTIANLNPTEADTVFQNQYWVVNRYGTGAFTTDLTFEISEDLTVEDESEPSQIKLYTRGSTADTSWALLTSASSVNAANNTATFEGLTALSQFIIAREINHGIELDLTTFLEGPYSGTEMNPSTGSGLPLLQPYNTAPWNYAGTESVDTIPADVVDWVMIELRDTTDAALATGETMIARRAAFILKDGKIVGLDGDSYKACPVSTTNTVVNNLFVVIYHRNHLPIMSANPLIKTNGIYTYDFSTAIGQVYGNSQADLGSGVYGMFAADMNADGVIDQADILLWEQVAGQSGYLMKDANLDSQVDNKDKNDLLVPNQNQSSQLPE